MRLSDVLSKEPSMKFEQVEGFLRKGLPHGGQQKLDVGVVCRNFYCKNCESELTFSTGEKTKISCVGVTNPAAQIEWLAPIKAVLENRLRRWMKIWSIDVVVFNQELARQYKLIS